MSGCHAVSLGPHEVVVPGHVARPSYAETGRPRALTKEEYAQRKGPAHGLKLQSLVEYSHYILYYIMFKRK